MSTQNDEINVPSIPSDPEVRRKIRQAVAEASAQLQMIDDRREALKDIKAYVAKELDVPAKTFTKMVKAFHKQQYASMVHENTVFQTYYENIMEDNT